MKLKYLLNLILLLPLLVEAQTFPVNNLTAAGTITSTGAVTAPQFIGNASTATSIPYSGLTGTVPIWNQNTLGTAASVTTASQPNITSIGTLTGLTSNSIVPIWSSYSNAYNPIWFNLNGFPVTSMNGNNLFGTASALTGSIDTPSTDTVWSQSINTGVTGYARSASPTKGSVGVFGSGMSNANGTSQWGANFVATNFNSASGSSTGQTSFTTIGMESDVYLNGTGLTGTVEGIKIAAAMSSIPSGGAYGIEIAPANVIGTLGWSCAICIDDSPNTNAVSIGTQGVGNNINSQSLFFKAKNSSGISKTAAIYSDTLGNLQLAPSSGAVGIPSGLSLGTNGSTSGTISIANGAVGGASVVIQNAAAGTTYDFNLPSSAGNSGQFLASGGSGSMFWSSPSCESILLHGGNNTNSADNTSAFSATIAAQVSGTACVYFPPGTYAFASNVSYTLPTSTASIIVKGAGQGLSNLIWSAGGGMTINYISAYNSAHIRDLSIQTGTTATGSGIALYQTASSIPNPALTEMSDITNVTVRGSDGYAGTDYWSNNIFVSGVSNVNFDGITIAGAGSVTGYGGTSGNGIVITGTSALVPVQFNITKSNFNSLNSGVYYGNYVQGVQISLCNFVAGTYGIFVPSALTALDQLTVSSSQFNVGTAAISISSSMANLLVNNNLFIVPNTSVGISLVNTGLGSIIGNSFNGAGTGSNNGIAINNSINNWPVVISGNSFEGIRGVGLWAQSSSSYITAINNVYVSGGTYSYLNQGMNNLMETALNSLSASSLVAANGYSATSLILSGGNSITTTAASAGIEHGSTTSAGTPYIDWHSSGNANDYDVRLIASGGTTNGTGVLNVIGANFQVNGVNTYGSLTGTTGSIGGSALLVGACSSGTVSITGATTAMTVSASPNTYPGDGFYQKEYVSSAGTVTVKVCAAVAGTPTSSTYNVRVIQ